MGNPHAVFWVDDVNAYDLAKIGPLFENHPMFPERANISLAHIVSRERIVVRVWERGAGLTKACGSAACAVVVAAARLKRVNRKATAALPGGDLLIDWRERDDHVLMTGPVAYEYEGRFDPKLFAPQRGSGVMGVDVVTFGCRLNAYEFGDHPPQCRRRRARRHRGRQHLRGDCRGGAAGEADDPQNRARAAGCAHRGHRLRGAGRAGCVRRDCRMSAG